MLITINDNIVGGEPGDVLTMIDPSTVESVEVKKGINVLYGNLSWGGILAIYTQFGPLEEGVKQSQNLPVVKVPGYATPRKFKYPDYNNWKTVATNTDYRSLIYWNPHVVTDDTTGTSSVSFFAADLAGRYYVVAEGVSKNGTPVRAEYFIEVTKH